MTEVTGPPGVESDGRQSQLRILSSAALVVTIAIAIPLCISQLRHGSASPASPNSAYVGYRWKLVSIQSKTGTTTMPESTRAGISFRSYTDLLLNDGVNVNNAQYTVSGSTITITSGPTTSAAYVGSEPHKILAIAAFAQLSGFAEGATNVKATLVVLDSETIQISVQTYQLRLKRIDVLLSPETTGSPSPSS